MRVASLIAMAIVRTIPAFSGYDIRKTKCKCQSCQIALRGTSLLSNENCLLFFITNYRN
ncbi:unnamed protein product [Callosobruchus maculatus]|uniref:Uncharacterized protein n=1 Tax=Callosobruchus maculatus TaxID=64391 RepID=A0A653D2U7_CALMS|nr:unnamed protein product [Callosobruchus maculatus]